MDGETQYKIREPAGAREGLLPMHASGLFILLVLMVAPTLYFQRHHVC